MIYHNITLCCHLLLFIHSSHHNLHYFPTRRSSDLRNLTYENPTGITTLAFHPNDRSLVAADAGGRVIRWNDDEVEGARLYAHRSEEHTSELQSPCNIVCRLLLVKNNTIRHKLYYMR